MIDTITGKVIVITGASRGLGEAWPATSPQKALGSRLARAARIALMASSRRAARPSPSPPTSRSAAIFVLVTEVQTGALALSITDIGAMRGAVECFGKIDIVITTPVLRGTPPQASRRPRITTQS